MWGEPKQARPNKNKGEELLDRQNKKIREQSLSPAGRPLSPEPHFSNLGLTSTFS